MLIVVLLIGILGTSLFQPSGWHKSFKVGLGLDLASGTTVTLKAIAPKGTSSSVLQTNMNTAVTIMNGRVNGAGFNGATVVPQGSNLINVTVPGQGVQKVVNLVGTTAQLRFRQVLLTASNYATSATPTPTPTASASPAASPSPTKKAASPAPSKTSALGRPGSGSGSQGLATSAKRLTAAPKVAASATPKASASASPSPSASASPSPSPSASSSTPKLSTTADGSGEASLLTAKTKALFNKLNCADKNWKQDIYGNNPNNWDNPGIQVVTCYQDQKYALDKSTVTGEMLKLGGSSASLQTNGNYWVNLTFNSKGAKAFGALSTKMYDSYYDTSTSQPKSELDFFAIVLDGTPVEVPYMGAVLDSGTAQIQGTFSQTQANNLVNVLNYGALPLTFQKISVESVSAQLGSYQLHAGLLAGLVGLLLVVIYAFLYYRGLGIVAISSLAIAALLSYLSVVLLSDYESFAMSLSGIAGLIVAIGITADSFVVFFERLRDEVRDGKSLRTAVERGWTRARRTILVSDTVSFIAAAVLYKFAVTDVQNFAFTLGLTTLVDVVVVFLFTKPTITLLARTTFFGQGHRLSGLDPARLGMRSPLRGSRRPAPRPQPGGAQASGPAPARPRTDPKEA